MNLIPTIKTVMAILMDHTARCHGSPSNPGSSTATAPSSAGGGLGDFTWTQVVTLAGALMAAAAVVLTLVVNARRARRDALATLNANALGAVADYLEGPYRILRKDGTASTRFAITSKLSDVKSAIDHNQALLRLHAKAVVADAYDDYVRMASREAGRQMHDAWNAEPVTTDAGVNLNVKLPREASSAGLARLCEVMQADLHWHWYRPKSWERYNRAVRATTDARDSAGPAKSLLSP